MKVPTPSSEKPAETQARPFGALGSGDAPVTLRGEDVASKVAAMPSATSASAEPPRDGRATSASAEPPRDGRATSASAEPPRDGRATFGSRSQVMSEAVEVSETPTIRCAVCLEIVPSEGKTCPECDEPFSGADAAPPSSAAPWSGLSPSLREPPEGASWLRLHWRPFITVGAVTTLLCTGVALRYLAPDRNIPLRAATARAQAPVCQPQCWNGEACKAGQCVWQKPNDLSHVSEEPIVSGPFPLPKDVTDALPLDGERFAVALLTGTRIQSTRTGEVLSHLSDTPQSRRFFRVGDTVYATAPQRIYVIDVATTRLLKTIETNENVTEISLGASGRRAVASMPAAHSVAVLATELHAEIERIQFGDDPVGPVGIDDSGKRALVTTGSVPLAGLRDPPGGAAYAFDPGRFASAQDRVRTSMLGNPVSVLMTPDGSMSYVVLRAENRIVPLEWLPSGAVRRKDAIITCREPEQIVLLRKGRRALVRCNEGRALDVVDLAKGLVIEHIPLNARAADMAVSPDGEQAVVALPDEANSSIALVNLTTYDVAILPVASEPTRVRLSPDGKTALILSDRAKVAWVLR